MKEKTQSGKGFAVTSLVMGILAIINSFILILNFISLIFAILAVIFGIIGIAKKASKGLAIAGLILGILSLILIFLVIIITSQPLQTSSNNYLDEKNILVPDFSTYTKNETEIWCKTFGANCKIVDEKNDVFEPGQFIRQSIKPESIIKSSNQITITFSTDTVTSNSNYNNLNVITNKKIRENFIIACKLINIDINQINDLVKKDDWNSGPRYTFFYKGTQFILYALDNGEISSITIVNNDLDKIYLDGYEPLDVNDFIFSSDSKIALRVKAEEKLKEYIKYPSTAKFNWMEYSYTRRYDIFQISGTVKAKNTLGYDVDNNFVIQFKSNEGNFDIVYLNVNGEKYIGYESQLKPIDRKELQIQESKTEDNSIILKDGVLGAYGKKDLFDGDEYIRYYIPSGSYKVEAITKNASFYIETIELHKEDGYDTATTIQTVRLSKVGDTTDISISDGQCISLIINTQVKLTKIN